MEKSLITTITDIKHTWISYSGPIDPDTADSLFQSLYSTAVERQNSKLMKINGVEFFVFYNFDSDQQTIFYLLPDRDPKMKYAVIDVNGICFAETRKEASALWFNKTERLDGLMSNSGKYFVSDHGELTALINLQKPFCRDIRFPK